MNAQVTTEFRPHVAVINGEIKTTSIVVAEHFGKLHKDVLKAVNNLDCSKEFHERNFAPMQIEVEIGNSAKRMSPAYEMTKDGFPLPDRPPAPAGHPQRLRRTHGRHYQGPNMTPRLLNLTDAAAYTGFSEPHFNQHVRPYVTVIADKRMIRFDRLELDAWIDHYKAANGRPAKEDTPWQKEPPAFEKKAESGKLKKSSPANLFDAALAKRNSKKQSVTLHN